MLHVSDHAKLYMHACVPSLCMLRSDEQNQDRISRVLQTVRLSVCSMRHAQLPHVSYERCLTGRQPLIMTWCKMLNCRSAYSAIGGS